MTDNLQQTLERLRGKSEILIERYRKLLQEKQDVDLRIKELSTLIEQQQKEIDRQQQEIEYLKVVTTLTPNRNDVEKSRAFLSELVREIDKCILELNE
ncbi:MAG: DUF3450 domain-containing protein [Bacteroidales bacterium]|nr:DUF3450 domain-containing protein [Bacteroidales bacterium]